MATRFINTQENNIKLTPAWANVLPKYYDYCSLQEFAERLNISASDVNLIATDLEQVTPYGKVIGVWDTKPNYAISGCCYSTLWVMEDLNGKLRLGAALGFHPVEFRTVSPKKLQRIFNKVFNTTC